MVFVRKHRAPKGALRLASGEFDVVCAELGQKAPSAKRCIKTREFVEIDEHVVLLGQKAPSAKRCIKTSIEVALLSTLSWKVRKHRAPKGALRR